MLHCFYFLIGNDWRIHFPYIYHSPGNVLAVHVQSSSRNKRAYYWRNHCRIQRKIIQVIYWYYLGAKYFSWTLQCLSKYILFFDRLNWLQREYVEERAFSFYLYIYNYSLYNFITFFGRWHFIPQIFHSHFVVNRLYFIYLNIYN